MNAVRALLVVALCAAPIAQAQVFKLADLDPTRSTRGGIPRHFVQTANGVVFISQDPSGLPIMWSVPTVGSPVILRVFPKRYTVNVQDIVYASASDGTLGYYVLDDGILGVELWATDGTVTGTRPVADLCPGPCGGLDPYTLSPLPFSTSNFPSFALTPSGVFFPGSDGTTGWEPWWWPGGSSPVSALTELLPGPGSGVYQRTFLGTATGAYFYGTSSPRILNVASGPGVQPLFSASGGSPEIYPLFNGAAAYTGFNPVRLIFTDGTDAGTRLLAQVNASAGRTGPVSVGTDVFFPVTFNGLPDQLLRTDGGIAIAAPEITDLAAANGTVFVHLDSDAGDNSFDTQEMWALNPAGGAPVKLYNRVSSPLLSTSTGVFFEVIGALIFSRGTPATSRTVLSNTGRASLVGERVCFSYNNDPWCSDGTDAGTVKIASQQFDFVGSRAAGGTRLGTRLFFSAIVPTVGSELFFTDGLSTGLAANLTPGAVGSFPRDLVAADEQLLFIAEAASGRPQLFAVTDAGVVALPLPPSDAGAFQAVLGGVGGSADRFFFSHGLPARGLFTFNDAGQPWRVSPADAGRIDDGGIGVFRDGTAIASFNGEPWRFSPDGGAQQLADIVPGAVGSLWPEAVFERANRHIYFPVVLDGGSALWRTDGTVAGTAEVIFFPDAGRPRNLASVGRWLSFTVDTPALGEELWVVRGPDAGAELLADLQPGRSSSYFEPPHRAGSFIYASRFSLDSGFEPIRFGPALTGTQPVFDVSPGPQSSRARDFNVLNGRLVFFAFGPDGDDEPWALDLPDVTPPIITAAPQGLASDAGWFRGTVSVQFALSDPESTAVVIDGCEPTTLSTDTRGQDFFCHAASEAGDTVLRYRVRRDGTAPVALCPGPVLAEAQSAAGALVSQPFMATATDNFDPSPKVSVFPASGTVFPLGTTPVTATAVDHADNVGTCTFDVVVVDRVKPKVSCPSATVVLEPDLGLDGGTLRLSGEVTATDTVDPVVDLNYVPPLGTVLPLGPASLVVARAADDAGNFSSCNFAVAVKDQKAPVLNCPSELRREATSPDGGQTPFPADAGVFAVDAVDPTPSVVLLDAGEVLPLGRHQLTVKASDRFGNEARCSFAVEVVDSQPPTLSCPAAEVQATATVTAGIRVPMELPGVSDLADPSPQLISDGPDAGVFPIGTTTVRYVATDASGNASECVVQVSVSCPTCGVVPTVKRTQSQYGWGCGCAASGAEGWAMLALVATMLRAFRARPLRKR